MSKEVLHPGDLFRVGATFTDVTGTLVDPTTVELNVVDPSETVTTYTYALSQITRASLGVFRKDIDIPVATSSVGEWSYFWVSTGSGQGGEPGQFSVEGHPFL